MKKIEKGIVLITTMLLLSFIIMISALLVVTGRNSLMLGASYADREQASYAADCGLSYIQYCISRYTRYAGTTTYDPSLPGFSVERVGSQNLIHGKFTANDAEFYVAFCDGNGSISTTSDIYSDSKGNYMLFYSYNNLGSDTEPYGSLRYNGGSYGSTGSYSPFKYVSRNSAHIIVEGRCNQARSYAEAILKYTGDQTEFGSSISAGDFTVNLADNDSVFMVNSAIAGESTISSLGNMTVTTGDPASPLTDDKNCFQIADAGVSHTGDSAGGAEHTYVNGTQVTTGNEGDYKIGIDESDQSATLKKAKLTWSEASGKYVSGGTFDSSNVKTTVTAGTYLYMNTGGGNTYDLFYFPVAYDPISHPGYSDAKAYMANWYQDNQADKQNYTGALIGGDTGNLSIDSSIYGPDLNTSGAYLWNVKNPVGVSEGNGNLGLSVLIYSYSSTDGLYFPSDSYRASVKLGEAVTTGKDPTIVTLSGSGRNVNIDGEISGMGKVIAGGNVSFQGGSIMDTNPDRAVNPNKKDSTAIYAQGDVTMNPVRGSGGANGVNDAIKEAWEAYQATLGASDGDGYYNTATNDYQKVIADILNTTIPGNFNATDSTGRTKTFTDAKLSDILTDTECFTFESEVASELVTMMLTKNSYLGTDSSTTGGGSTTTDYGLASMPSSAGTVEDSGDVAAARNWVINNPDLAQQVQMDGKTYHVAANASSSRGYVTFVNLSAPTTDYFVGFSKNGGSTQYNQKGSAFGSSATFAPTSTYKFNIQIVSQGGQNYVFDLQNNSGSSAWVWTDPTAGGSTNNNNSPTVKILNKDDTDFVDLVFNDTIIKGLVYTWGDINAFDMQKGNLTIRGGLVAYGDNPDTWDPTTSSLSTGKGKVNLLNGKFVTFTYDPDYMTLLLNSSNGINTKRTFSSTWDGSRVYNQTYQ